MGWEWVLLAQQWGCFWLSASLNSSPAGTAKRQAQHSGSGSRPLVGCWCRPKTPPPKAWPLSKRPPAHTSTHTHYRTCLMMASFSRTRSSMPDSFSLPRLRPTVGVENGQHRHRNRPVGGQAGPQQHSSPAGRTCLHLLARPLAHHGMPAGASAAAVAAAPCSTLQPPAVPHCHPFLTSARLAL